MISNHMLSCDMILHDAISYDITSYDIIWCYWERCAKQPAQHTKSPAFWAKPLEKNMNRRSDRWLEAWTLDRKRNRQLEKHDSKNHENQSPEGSKIKKIWVWRGSWDSFFHLPRHVLTNFEKNRPKLAPRRSKLHPRCPRWGQDGRLGRNLCHLGEILAPSWEILEGFGEPFGGVFGHGRECKIEQ